MQVKAVTAGVRAPLLLLALVELATLYSSFYVAGLLCIGTVFSCEQFDGLFDPRAVLFAGLSLVSFIAMGLYQFNQRLYFRQAMLRVLVGLVFSSAAAGVFFSVVPGFDVSGPQFALVFGYSLAVLLAIRFYFVRTVDENLFRRRTIVFGAGERAASLMDLRRRADRRGFKIVGRIASETGAKCCSRTASR